LLYAIIELVRGVMGYTGRFIRADAGDEGDASVPTPHPHHPRPYGNELPCLVQVKPTCEGGVMEVGRFEEVGDEEMALTLQVPWPPTEGLQRPL
jgi:hypothetical protein